MNLVLQIQIPDDQRRYPTRLVYDEKLYAKSKAAAQEYAERTGADYLRVDDDRYLPGLHASYQRLGIFEMLEYEHILYIDSDAVVMPGCPDIFHMDYLGLAAVPDFSRDTEDPSHRVREERARRRLGFKTQVPFCAGVMLTSRDWREKQAAYIRTLVTELRGDLELGYGRRMRDQEILNLAQGENPYTQLSPDWGAWYCKGKYIDHSGNHL